MKVSEIAEYLNGTLEGKTDIEIKGIAKIESADKSDITFISNPVYEKFYQTTKAGVIIVSKEFKPSEIRTDITLLRVNDPYSSFITALNLFKKETEEEISGISEKASIGKDSVISQETFIDDFVKIGNNCSIGSKTRIKSNTTIGNNVIIGNNSKIESNVTIYDGCKIGNNVIIHSGTVIGSDGFGFARDNEGKFAKIPQTGIVVIEDDVEIGSNCSIDRATIGETLICKRVKLDNQIQIAHNVIIGEDTVIAAQAGIAGSTKIGKRCMIGGQAGIVGHLTICDDTIIGASVGVSKSITKPGYYTGYRAKPMREELKEEVNIKKIEELKSRIKILEDEIKKLTS